MVGRAKVRIREIELEGFKNTQHGLIQMPSVNEKNYFADKVDILGIYGQNGSGKTAVVEAMAFMQILMMGQSLPATTVNYISKGVDQCSITVRFSIETTDGAAMVEYGTKLKPVGTDDFQIERETLSASTWTGDKFGAKRILIDYNVSAEGTLFLPKYRFEELTKGNEENRINLSVAKRIAQKEHSSFIFGAEGRDIFVANSQSKSQDYGYMIQALFDYAQVNLFVISNAHAGAISVNFVIPLAFRFDFDEKIAKGDLPIRLDQPSVISREDFHIATEIIKEMNAILGTIIPGLSIEIYNYGEQLIEDGSLGYKIELISRRGQVQIPIKYESEGIIKIISVLNALICVYNNSSMCLIIDELDAGIFEYLLGELLSVFDKGAKGQLIFTSHNLRALEMLHKKSIIFSTTNPQNRYIHLQNVKSNNNLRDMYLRSISLGGQKEDVYDETDSVEIGRAFRRAKKVGSYGDKN